MKKQFIKSSLALIIGIAATSAYAVDACSDVMGHSGNGTEIKNSATGSINGTKWGFEQWFDGGNNSMTYYPNGTFSAKWNGSNDYLARVGFRYGDNGPGEDHTKYQYTVDYKYTKTGSASYGYIGVYGWTVSPQVEYYIVDDWFSKPNEQYIGAKRGEITVDGATYTIHATSVKTNLPRQVLLPSCKFSAFVKPHVNAVTLIFLLILRSGTNFSLVKLLNLAVLRVVEVQLSNLVRLPKSCL